MPTPIGLGETSDHYHVGLRTIVNRETEKLLKVVTRVPVTTGATLRRLLQVRAVRHVQKELGSYFNNNRVLFLSGMRNYEIAVALSDYTKNLSFADPVFQAGSPMLLSSLAQLELYARGNELVAGQNALPPAGEVAGRAEEHARGQRHGQVAPDRGHLRRDQGHRHGGQPGRQDDHHLGRARRPAGLLQAVQGQPGDRRHAPTCSAAWSAWPRWRR